MANVRSVLDSFARRKGFLISWCFICRRCIGVQRVDLAHAGISDGLHPGKCVERYKREYGFGRKAVA